MVISNNVLKATLSQFEDWRPLEQKLIRAKNMQKNISIMGWAPFPTSDLAQPSTF